MVRSVTRLVTHPHFELFIRTGLLIRGFIYVLLGIFTLEYALGISAAAVDLEGVIRRMFHNAASVSSMYLVAMGLLAYSLWGVIRAIYDPYNKGVSLSGYAARFGYLTSAVAYGWLSTSTFQLLLKTPSIGNTAVVIPTSAGRISLGIGVLWFIAAIGQLTHAVSYRYTQELNLHQASVVLKRIYIFFGFIGLLGRTLVFGVMSFFFIKAGLFIGTTPAPKMDQVFNQLHVQPLGDILLLLIAFGLIAFGVYSFLAGFLQKYVPSAVDVDGDHQQHTS